MKNKTNKNTNQTVSTILAIFVAIVMIALFWKFLTSDRHSATPTPTLPIIFTGVAKEEDLICYFENNDSKAIIPKFRIVGVVGINSTGQWVLIRTEDYPDCWVLLSFLDIQGNNINALPLIKTSFPPIVSPVVNQSTQSAEAPAQPTEEPATEEPATEEPATEEPATEEPALVFDVKVEFKTIECACGGKPGKADVILTFINGSPPYVVNGQAPVQGDTVSFRTSLGVSFDLTVVDVNGNEWKEEDIAAPYCSDDHCEKQPGPGQTDPGPTDSCTETEVQYCEDIVTTVDVCIKWPPGNPDNCLEWKKQQKTDHVCRTEVVCK